MRAFLIDKTGGDRRRDLRPWLGRLPTGFVALVAAPGIREKPRRSAAALEALGRRTKP